MRSIIIFVHKQKQNSTLSDDKHEACTYDPHSERKTRFAPAAHCSASLSHRQHL